MFYDQLNKLCKENNTTPTAFITDKLGLSSSKITAWKGGAIPKYGILQKISEYFKVPVSYLFSEDNDVVKPCLEEREIELISLFKQLDEYDKGKVFSKAETLAELAAERVAEQKKENNTEQNDVIDKCLPLNGTCDKTYYNRAACAGTGLYLDEASAETITVRSTPEALAADFAIPISGDSMEDEYHDGDIVLVESCPCVRKGEVGIFLIDGDVCIKEYRGRFLTSYNSKYSPVDLSKHESVFCLGRVIGIAEPIV